MSNASGETSKNQVGRKLVGNKSNYNDLDDLENDSGFTYNDSGEAFDNAGGKKKKKKAEKGSLMARMKAEKDAKNSAESSTGDVAKDEAKDETKSPEVPNREEGFVAKNKMMLIVAGVGLLAVGGYFMFGKQLGIK